jgi:hypothetical protein
LPGFGKTSPKDSGTERETGTDEIERSPSVLRFRDNSQVDHRTDQVAHRVALLEDTRAETSSSYWNVLESAETGMRTYGVSESAENSRCSRLTPNTPHSDTEQGSAQSQCKLRKAMPADGYIPYSQELRVSIDESRAELKDGNQAQIRHKCPFATKSIGENTKDQGTKGSEEQRKGNGGSNML